MYFYVIMSPCHNAASVPLPIRHEGDMLQPLLINLQILLLHTLLYRQHNPGDIRPPLLHRRRRLLLRLPLPIRRPQRDVRLAVSPVDGVDLPAPGVEGDFVAGRADHGGVDGCEGRGGGGGHHGC